MSCDKIPMSVVAFLFNENVPFRVFVKRISDFIWWMSCPLSGKDVQKGVKVRTPRLKVTVNNFVEIEGSCGRVVDVKSFFCRKKSTRC